ncbi:hypothetical protein Thewi_2501 [Thermoanaerobacter wiegelii Rt8.B1]|uniref:DUF4179 domain-containing protein n=2 Tax=Thermoanaerobacter TaxID=1754 RepID=G2MU01_9THEO|nr:hypothetical protein Thewi_2501 [Thermoanaerobacter wiegelii Rt8.B1]
MYPMNRKFDRQIRDLLQKSNIEVPENFHKRIENTLNMIKERKGDNKVPKNTTSKKITLGALLKVASLLIVTILTIGIIDPAIGKNIPIIDSVFEYLSNRGIEKTEYQKYTVGIGASQISKGVEVTLNEAAFDGSRLVVGYIIKANHLPKKIEKDKIFVDSSAETAINNENLSAGSNTVSGILTNDNTFIASAKYELVRGYLDKIPSSIDVKINIREITFYEGTNRHTIKGNWNFNFTIPASKTKVDLKILEPKIVINDKLGKIKFNKIILSPFSTSIEIEAPQDPVVGWYEYTDEYQYMQPSLWTVTDDKGNILKWEAEYNLFDINGKVEKDKAYPRLIKFSPVSSDTAYINIKSSKFEVKLPVK